MAAGFHGLGELQHPEMVVDARLPGRGAGVAHFQRRFGDWIRRRGVSTTSWSGRRNSRLSDLLESTRRSCESGESGPPRFHPEIGAPSGALGGGTLSLRREGDRAFLSLLYVD